MEFSYNEKTTNLLDQIKKFMDENVYPIEQEIYDFTHDPKNLWVVPEQIEELKKKAKSEEV